MTRSRYPASIAAVAALLTLAGCAGIGPTARPDWPQHVARAVPAADGAIQLESVGNWIPDALGLTDVRSIYAPLIPARPGVFVIASDAAMFLQWDRPNAVYRIIWRQPFSQIERCWVDAIRRLRRLVIVEADYRNQSFELTGPADQLIDDAATARAESLLRASVPNGCGLGGH